MSKTPGLRKRLSSGTSYSSPARFHHGHHFAVSKIYVEVADCVKQTTPNQWSATP